MKLSDLQALLSGDATVTAICSARVYPILIPEDAIFPAVVLNVLKNQPMNALDGYSGLDLAHVMVDSLAVSYRDARRLRDAVRASLQAAQLIMTEETEDYEDVIRTYRISQQWDVWN
jgi:hypothetical protein